MLLVMAVGTIVAMVPGIDAISLIILCQVLATCPAWPGRCVFGRKHSAQSTAGCKVL